MNKTSAILILIIVECTGKSGQAGGAKNYEHLMNIDLPPV